MSQIDKILGKPFSKRDGERILETLRPIEDAFYLRRQLKLDSANKGNYRKRDIIAHRARRLLERIIE